MVLERLEVFTVYSPGLSGDISLTKAWFGAIASKAVKLLNRTVSVPR